MPFVDSLNEFRGEKMDLILELQSLGILQEVLEKKIGLFFPDKFIYYIYLKYL